MKAFPHPIPLLLSALLFLLASSSLSAQKVIEYQSGIGSRDPDNSDVWILYDHVRAQHEGMVLFADSAILNTAQNDFTAFRHIKILLSDTTTIYGDHLFYDGNTRIVDIWDDTVVFIDGATTLLTAHISFDRNTNTATYTTWGHTTNRDRILTSRSGIYDATNKVFHIYRKVTLQDSNSRLETDTLHYNTQTSVAEFNTPTHIYSDSTTIYSECGSYNTDTRYAVSTKASHVVTGTKIVDSDTLYYDDIAQHGTAYGNLLLRDTANDLTCTGKYGVTDQQQRYSFVTDSAQVLFVDKGDSVFLHADTVLVVNDTAHQIQIVKANHHVKLFRNDAQAMCDSAYYSVSDSLIQLFYDPVVWYENYQCTADTIFAFHDTVGLHLVLLKSNLMVVEKVDSLRFNQIKGRNGAVYFLEGEPTYGDVLGNAQMVYYITEEDSLHNLSLVGVNAGIGSDMRLYFKKRQMHRLVTFGSPDMHTYPVNQLPNELNRLPGFQWLESRRPLKPQDIFIW